MAERNPDCLLGKEKNVDRCKKCGNCGWNRKVAEQRNAEIAANGLTLTDAQAYAASTPLANVHAQDCTEATVWRQTHLSKPWSTPMLLPSTV